MKVFGACESGCRCAGVCTRVSKNRGRVLAKTNLRRRKSGGSLRRGDAVVVVDYREVVKREFARENPSPFRPSPGVRGSPSVSLYRPRNRLGAEQNAFDIFAEKTSRIDHVLIRRIIFTIDIYR